MQTQTLSVLFWLYRSKENKEGKCPIYLRVTLQKRKLNFSTGQFVEPEEWDRRKQRVKGKSDNAQLTNAILRQLESKLINLQRELLLKKGEIIFDDIRAALSGDRQPSATLISSFQKHNERILSLVGRGYAKATFEIYEITKREIQEFLRAKSKREDISLQEIDIQFAQNLEVFYRLNKGNQTNTIYKKFQRIKKILNQAVDHGQLHSNPLKAFRLKKEKKSIVFLTEEEIGRIQKLKITIPRLEGVRKLFLLSCFTGLAYNELSRLSETNLEIGQDKIVWIKIQRQKTNKWVRIPLLPQAQKILSEIRGVTPFNSKFSTISLMGNSGSTAGSRLLSVPTNQKMNAYLKEIADLARISKNLTSHVARKTFATTITLLQGVSIETISKLLGHSSIRVTQEAYSEITEQKLLKELLKKRSP